MRNPVIILRCDYSANTGIGHLKRCDVLSGALQDNGFQTLIALDQSAKDLNIPIPIHSEIVYLASKEDTTETDDALYTLALAESFHCNIVIKDSYRYHSTWEKTLKERGLQIISIDDLETSHYADIIINYAPKINAYTKNIEENTTFLHGVKYTITNFTKFEFKKVTQYPKNVVIHAGGASLYNRAKSFYIAISKFSHLYNWNINWICSNDRAKHYLSNSGVLKKTDNVLNWKANSTTLWRDYDIMIGPASTSLYEAILQGILPITCTISSTQTDNRDAWLNIGHALHLNYSETQSDEIIRNVMELAHTRYNDIIQLLEDYASELDGKGAHRIVQHVKQLSVDSPPSSPKPQSPRGKNTVIRKCDIRDAEAFRLARNHPKTRQVSTNPGHMITWPEHLNWWLSNSVERFVIVQEGAAEAYFWHRELLYKNQNYLVGGWFPSTDRPIFTSVIKLLKWQIEYCSTRYTNHRWLAVIRKDNSAVLSLNKRMGFKIAQQETEEAAKAFFPDMTDEFQVLEK